MQDTILSIAGKPGLYKLLTQGRGMLIVETVDDAKRRVPAGARDRVTSLNDVSMYTEGDEVPLMQVFENISKRQDGGLVELNYKSATSEELASFMADVLPEYDRDRVRTSDIRKLIQWYNILAANGYTHFIDETSEAAAPASEEAAAEAPVAE